MPTTARAALRYPTLANIADVPADIANLANDTDGKIIIWLPPDVIANRPGASLAGRAFYATDQAILYLDNGAIWVQLNNPRYRGKGTLFPASPQDGDLFDWDVYNALVGSGYFPQADWGGGGEPTVWSLIYYSGHTYPWKIRGRGPSLRSVLNGQGWRTAGGYGDLTSGIGVGPYIYAPRTGYYHLKADVSLIQLQTGGALSSMFAEVEIVGATHGVLTNSGNRIQIYDSAAGQAWVFPLSIQTVAPVLLNVGEQIKVQYNQNTGFTSGILYQDISLELIPVAFQ